MKCSTWVTTTCSNSAKSRLCVTSLVPAEKEQPNNHKTDTLILRELHMNIRLLICVDSVFVISGAVNSSFVTIYREVHSLALENTDML